MTERTIVSDAPAAPAPAAVAPAEVNITPIPARGALGEKPAAGGLRIEAMPAGQPTGAPRPAWLQEKFKSPEELAQAYNQLEQRLGQLGRLPAPAAPAAPAPVAGAPAAPVSPGEAPATPAQAPAPAGASDLQARMTQEYATTGQVSAALRQEFQQRTGLDASFIDNQLAFLRQQGASTQAIAEQRLGGAQAVAELTEWAKSRLSPEERATFNRLVYSGDEAAARLAIDGVAAKYEAEVGRAPRIIAGRRPQSDFGGVIPFQSEHELLMAQKDKRYKEDPGFREQVMDRLRASQKLGLL